MQHLIDASTISRDGGPLMAKRQSRTCIHNHALGRAVSDRDQKLSLKLKFLQENCTIMVTMKRENLYHAKALI
jgi:hypothetical protein